MNRARRIRPRSRRRASRAFGFLARVWALPVWAHVGGLAVLTLALLPFMHVTDAAWIDDEGLYARQVEALQDGAWEYEWVGASLDPEVVSLPIYRTTPGEGGRYMYVAHPTYVVALHATTTLLGDALGYPVLPVLGFVLAAVSAWLLAGEVDPRASRPAFWLVACSPLVVNAYMLWAHTLSATLAGFALVAAARIVRRGPTPVTGLGLVAALAAGVLLRSEAILFALALVAALAGFLVVRRRLTAAVAIAGSALLAVGTAVMVELRWIEAIVGHGRDIPSARVEAADRPVAELLGRRLSALWRITFDGGPVEARLETLVVISLVVVVVAGLALRLRGREGGPLGVGALVIGVVAVAFLYGARFSGPLEVPAYGFFAAWPLALLGLVTAPWRATATAERLLAAAVVLFAAAVFATQYDVGGGGEWGGRFLSAIVVPVAVAVAVGLVRRLADRPRGQQVTAVVALACLALVPAWSGLEVVRTSRGELAQLGTALEESLTGVAVLSYTDRIGAYPHRLWPLDEHVDWFVARSADLRALMSELAEAGFEEITLVRDTLEQESFDAPYAQATDVTPEPLRKWHLQVVAFKGPTRGVRTIGEAGAPPRGNVFRVAHPTGGWRSRRRFLVFG